LLDWRVSDADSSPFNCEVRSIERYGRDNCAPCSHNLKESKSREGYTAAQEAALSSVTGNTGGTGSAIAGLEA
jgi:hypothetical protein